MIRYFNENDIERFHKYLLLEEKSSNTIDKYLRDVHKFMLSIQLSGVSKETVIMYKNHLITQGYSNKSINSMLASINSFLSFMNWNDCKVKSLKIQRQIYCSQDKELTKDEYRRLVKAAKKKNNERLCLLMQTICTTGIRVSELQFITVEAVVKGEVTVSLKGKIRTVFLVRDLRNKLIKYIHKNRISSGVVFRTKNGNPLFRSNIWKDMKNLCIEANVNPKKVFPHNLRHLFARTFYNLDKDIAKLADILGHSSIDTTRIYITTTYLAHQRCIENMRLLI